MHSCQFVGISCFLLFFCSSYGYVVDTNSVTNTDSSDDGDLSEGGKANIKKILESLLQAVDELGSDTENQEIPEIPDIQEIIDTPEIEDIQILDVSKIDNTTEITKQE